MAFLDSAESVNGLKKVVVSVWTVFECWLFTGMFVGWGSLVFILKEEGVYEYLCESPSSSNDSVYVGSVGTESNSDCGRQDERFALCFTLATFTFGGFSWLLGYINYETGTRVTRLIANVMQVSGLLCLAFVNEENPWLIFPGLCLCSVAGITLYVTNAQVAYVFTKHSSTYIGLLNGALDSSSVIFLFIKIAHDHGFARRNMFFILTALYCLTLVNTFIFLAKAFVNRIEEWQEKKEDAIYSDSDDNPQRVFQCMKQPLFITFVLWESLLMLRFLYVLGSLNTFLNDLLNNDNNKVSYYTNVCFYTMMAAIFTSIVAGAFYDHLRRMLMKINAVTSACSLFVGIFLGGQSQLYKNVVPAIIPMAVASLLAVLLSVMVLVQYEPLLYVVFTAILLQRSFLFSMLSAYIRAVFPSRYFGALHGVAMTAGSLCSCLQYAFLHWIESYHNGRFHADICLLFISLLTLGHPVFMWISASRAEKKLKCAWNKEDERDESGIKPSGEVTQAEDDKGREN